jgi:hypothetical protein
LIKTQGRSFKSCKMEARSEGAEKERSFTSGEYTDAPHIIAGRHTVTMQKPTEIHITATRKKKYAMIHQETLR